jgi:hypothetical protein
VGAWAAVVDRLVNQPTPSTYTNRPTDHSHLLPALPNAQCSLFNARTLYSSGVISPAGDLRRSMKEYFFCSPPLRCSRLSCVWWWWWWWEGWTTGD